MFSYKKPQNVPALKIVVLDFNLKHSFYRKGYIPPLKYPTLVLKVGTAGTAGAGQTTFGWTKSDLDEEKNWTYYRKSEEILPYSDKLDIWIFNK